MRWLLVTLILMLMFPAEALGWKGHFNPSPREQVKKVKVKKPKVSDQRAAFRKNLVRGAISYIGIRERGNNSGKMVLRFLRNSGIGANPWCGAFVWYVADRWGMYDGPRPSNTAYVPTIASWAHSKDAAVPPSLARPGMFATVNGNSHICMITKVNGNTVTTVGGNESDRVRKTTRSKYSLTTIIDLARLKYP